MLNLHFYIHDGPKHFVVRPRGVTNADMPQYIELGKCIYGSKQAARSYVNIWICH